MASIEVQDDPWVRVLIVNYNGGAFLQPCVDALAAQTLQDFEAVIVDNASVDGSLERLRLPDTRFKVLRNASNLGFAAANNIGAYGSQTPWLATLNPDTVAEPTWLYEMHRGVRSYPEARMFGATLLRADDATVVDGFGDSLSIAGIAWRRYSGASVTELPNIDVEVFSPCAAAALYERSCFEKAGGFDESFFCYIEDVDLAFRLRLMGEHCMQLRNAIVFHHASGIAGELSDFALFHSYRNRLWLLFKDMPWSLLAMAVLLNILCSVVMIAAMKITHMGTNSTASLKGLLLGLAPSAILRRRRRVQNNRKIATGAVARCLTWNLYQRARSRQ